MTVSLKHSKVTTKPDGTDASLIQPSDWNADHVLTQDSNRLLGRTTAGVGATEEISVGSGLTLGTGTLSANVTSVAGRTGAVTLAVADVSGAAPLASPALTGTPTAPTAATATNTTQIATTAFVKAQSYLTTTSAASTYAPLASPALTGTPTAPTALADDNTTQVATTAYVVGQASATSPVMDGTAAVGTSLKYARADHVHPTDTSRAPLASPAFTGTPTAPTAATATNTTQIATTAYVKAQGYLTTTSASSTYAPLASPALTGTPTAPTALADTNTTQVATTAFVVGQASSANPLVDGTANPGTSLKFAREDHVHPTDPTRAPLASPAFTGTPTAPTAATATNTTQIATTAFVKAQSYLTTTSAASTYAPLASPTFTGTVTIPAGASISGYLTTSAAAAGYVPQTATTGAATLPSGTSAQRPGTPAAGQVRYNTNTGKFEGYSTAWGNLGGGAAIGDNPPANPGAGDLWWDSNDGNLYVYYTDANTSQWVSTTIGGQGEYLPLTGGTMNGALYVSGNNFDLYDDTDPTKIAQFSMSGISTGTTRTYTFPNASGTLALTTNTTQTFTGNTTFSNATVTVGTSTGAATYGLGTGATTNGTTKTINIGTAGVSGSITNVNIGSAVAGSLGTVTVNSNTNITGSVGIGATGQVSGYQLAVDGRGYFGDSTDMTPDGNWSGQVTIKGNGYGGGLALDASGIWLGANSPSRGIIFAVNETEEARITTAGNFITGTTASSAGKITAISAGADSQNGVYGEANTKTASGSYGVHGRSNVSSTYSSGGVMGMSINANTYGISGYWSGSAYFSFYGNGNSFVSGTWQTSDARLKENVETIESALNTITALRPVAFDWKQNSDAARNGLSHDYGLIAQEVLPILPDIVQEIDAPLVSEDMTPSLNNELGSFYTIEYSRLIPHLIAAVQELKVELDAAKAEIAALKGAQ